MFKLSGAQKERYEEALNSYNKAVAAAQKQFLADVKDKAGLSQAELALAQTWFAVGLNPEINKILSTKSESTKSK
jgi:uridine kinase